MGRHNYGIYSLSSKGEGHPILISFRGLDLYAPFRDGGGYPKGFLELAYREMGVEDPDKVLHVCSGSLATGITVDIRLATKPLVVADGQKLPFQSNSFRWILIDPPYTKEYAKNLYGTEYPKPGRLLGEAARVLQENGKVGLLHFLIPMFHQPLKMLGVYGITCGLGQNIRAFSVFQKRSSARWRNGR